MNDLVERLRGIYRVPITDGLGPAGGMEPNNPNEFVRQFETPPIQREAADEIERMRIGIKRLSDEEELCAETTGDDPFSMVYLAAKLAKAEAEARALNIEASNHAADAETVRRERDALIRANGLEKIGHVTAGELAHLRLGVSCIDLFGEAVPAGVEMVPVFVPAAPNAKGCAE